MLTSSSAFWLRFIWSTPHCSYICVSIAVMGQHLALISLWTSTDPVYPVMSFCFIFLFFLSLVFEFKPFGNSLNAWSHWSAVSALNSFLLQLDESTEHAIHTWHLFFTAQFLMVDVSLHFHAMCQMSSLCASVLYLRYKSHFAVYNILPDVVVWLISFKRQLYTLTVTTYNHVLHFHNNL